MITQPKLWQRFEDQLRAKNAPSYSKARKLFDALYEEARSLGVLPTPNRLEGLKKDLRLARALNHPKLK